MNKSSVLSRVVWVTIFGCLIACEEPVEGCLDAAATNFSVSADGPCLDCCTYPVLKADFAHQWITIENDTTNFRYDSAYTIAPWDQVPVQFQRIKFYIAQMHLWNGTDSVLVNDTITLTVGNGATLDVEDNFGLVDRDLFDDVELGSFRSPGEYDGISFWLGIPTEYQSADPTLVPGDHPLRIQSDSLNWEESLGYISNKVVFFRDTITGSDSTVINVIEPVYLKIDLSETITVAGGFDVVLEFDIFYNRWFGNLNLATATVAEISQQIVSNLSNSIAFSGLTLE
ncbi:MAG: MbnP family protein [Bacteroidota bacterium]